VLADHNKTAAPIYTGDHKWVEKNILKPILRSFFQKRASFLAVQIAILWKPNYDNNNVNWGGTLNEKHYTELRTKSNDLGTIKEAFVTGDATSDKRIQSLHPAIRMQATDFIKEANANSSGTLIRVAQGYRTYAEQDALYAKGRTAPGKIVNLGKRRRNVIITLGLAFDMLVLRTEK